MAKPGRARLWRVRLAAALSILLVAAPVTAQRLLYGSWQARFAGTAATLTIITVDGDGSIHGTLYYTPPLDGFAGAPFTTRIENGVFAIRFANGTRYDGLHWCRATLCGTYYALDDTATWVVFSRPDG